MRQLPSIDAQSNINAAQREDRKDEDGAEDKKEDPTLERKINLECDRYNRLFYAQHQRDEAQVSFFEVIRRDWNWLSHQVRADTCSKVLFYLALFSVALYIVSPLDLLPESLLGPYGYVDDLLFIVGLFVMVHVGAQRARFQAQDQDADGGGGGGGAGGGGRGGGAGAGAGGGGGAASGAGAGARRNDHQD
jgi:uncharacterized membrane protein YgcG